MVIVNSVVDVFLRELMSMVKISGNLHFPDKSDPMDEIPSIRFEFQFPPQDEVTALYGRHPTVRIGIRRAFILVQKWLHKLIRPN
jgi:hypothetical protein